MDSRDSDGKLFLSIPSILPVIFIYRKINTSQFITVL